MVVASAAETGQGLQHFDCYYSKGNPPGRHHSSRPIAGRLLTPGFGPMLGRDRRTWMVGLSWEGKVAVNDPVDRSD